MTRTMRLWLTGITTTMVLWHPRVCRVDVYLAVGHLRVIIFPHFPAAVAVNDLHQPEWYR